MVIETDDVVLQQCKDSEIRFGINRKQENIEVLEYSNTGDEDLFKRLFERRKQTFDCLARQYTWLSEDALSEIKIIFFKTAQKYGKNGRKTDFNTFFYSSVKNHFVNSIKRKYRKKRTTIDGGDPLNKTMALDNFIGENEDSNTLHELVVFDNEKLENIANFQDCVNIISNGNKLVEQIIKSFSGLNRNQILRDHPVISCSFPVISGNILEDVIIGADLPQDSFEIMSSSVQDSVINVELKISAKKFISSIIEKISEKKSVYEEITGKTLKVISLA